MTAGYRAAHAICIRALLEYIQVWPEDATAITAVTAVGNAFGWLATQLSTTGPTVGRCYGGPGTYSGSPQVFNQGQPITWVSTEHQIDIYAALSLAATVLSTPS